MAGPVAALERVTRLLDAKLASRGLAYPWWVPVFSICGEVGAALISLAQRDALLPPRPVALVLVLVLGAHASQFFSPTYVGWWADAAIVIGATAWLLSDPIDSSGPADTAPVLMMILAAVVIARDGVLPGVVVTAVSAVVLVLAGAYWDLATPGLYVLEVFFGLDIGFLILWQMKALAAERRARARERSRATLAERERIAREIHDLVAHSLSVTLLHLAGAKHSLRDGEVTEAMDALDDAERIGRQAMADIRRTIGGLSVAGSDPSSTRPLPAPVYIAALVGEFGAAGLDVRYTVTGDVGRLPAPAGLGLYRITQEALSNVAKHAPRSTVLVSLELARTEARLAVRNDLAGRPRVVEGGAGVPGMTARATGLGGTIRVGPQDDAWVVEVRLPLTADTSCAFRRAAP
jgi:signal transduction histidine kinase